MRNRALLSTLVTVGLLAACSGSAELSEPAPGDPPTDQPDDVDEPEDVGAPVALELSSAAADEIEGEVAAAQEHNAASLVAAYPVSFSDELGYELADVQNLDLIQASALGLNDAELEKLGANGFVISSRLAYPSFPYAYAAIYVHDLPVFVSGDMVLEAVHRSYDDMLQALEVEVLIPRVQELLNSMRARLEQGGSGLSEQAAIDADFYLTVAHGLLTGGSSEPVAGASSSDIASFLADAEAAEGEQQKQLFGVLRRFDFSQFVPRGHYTDSPTLERYFRAMMWMGRIDFRMIETTPTGERVFRRRQLEAALAMRALMDTAALEDWTSVDRTITAFVGEHDYMIVPELDQLLSDLGVIDLAGLSAIDDTTIAQAIIDGSYGEQRIASHIMRKEKSGAPGTFPLNASFAFFGQRYVIDSHVFSNVVYDRTAKRVVPNPLDAAFAALKNDHAVSLLASELEEWEYAGDLAAVRAIADAHPEAYWEGSLYTSWLGALQTLSANEVTRGSEAAGLPSVARSEVWGRRLLNTQLGSWAQLRHDTILYAKQSYTGSDGCDFPDAYVDPYPELFRKLSAFADRGQVLVDSLELDGSSYLGERITQYFGHLSRITTTLAEMAEAQRTGMPHSEEHLTFIKQAIHVDGEGSGDPWQDGWYKDLFFDPVGGLERDPTIADVHTDIGGDLPVPRSPSVLHVGTGDPRMMVMTVDSCQGPRAYAGAVFAYHEHLAEGFTRLTDEEWMLKLAQDPPAEVPWMGPVLAE